MRECVCAYETQGGPIRVYVCYCEYMCVYVCKGCRRTRAGVACPSAGGPRPTRCAHTTRLVLGPLEETRRDGLPTHAAGVVRATAPAVSVPAGHRVHVPLPTAL
jgi:hypothetical protein